MNQEEDKQNEPICRFGPGGDFVWVWPRERLVSPQAEAGGLGRLLGRLNEIMFKLLGSEEDKSEYVNENSKADSETYAASATVIRANRQLQREPMLFSDDWGAGVGTGSKPKHRVRTHRRASKKRPSLRVWGQGSLFDADLRSARTA